MDLVGKVAVKKFSETVPFPERLGKLRAWLAICWKMRHTNSEVVGIAGTPRFPPR